MTDNTENIFTREASFHDTWAKETKLSEVAITEAFESITALENRFALQLIGNLKGKKILDVGCGLGESSIYFATKGALVTASDISPKMIELLKRNASQFNVQVEGIVSAGEALEVPANTYDVVFAANIMHHVANKDQFLKSAHEALKPGGLFVAWDPLKYNPVINVYRHMATKVRTEDEKPLGLSDLNLSKKYFPNICHREFWFLTLFLFLKYYLINRKNPNQTRYWKTILKETPESIGWWFGPFKALDNVLLRLPGLRLMAWNMVQWGNKT